MQEELAKSRVRVIALSKDSVQEAAAHRERDALTLLLLSDPALAVIRQYGVEHHKALELGKSKRPSFKTMAIPTTLLIDDSGIIRWIDQSDDYRLRSDNERVLEAVTTTLG